MNIYTNTPDQWINELPVKQGNANKYDYGYAFVYAAPDMTGATCLAATACARMGVGLVSVLVDNNAYNIYRTILPPHIITQNDLAFNHNKLSARLYGCGGLPCPVDFQRDIPTVLDAAALENLPKKLTPHYILTPHEGEFTRIFPDIDGEKEEKALKAAKAINSIIVLKGEITVIASPDGRLVINEHASPHLATAGTGDVLAGMITGLLAQKMDCFQAACAAVWMHGDAAIALGEGMVASDIQMILPKVKQSLQSNYERKSLGFLG